MHKEKLILQSQGPEDILLLTTMKTSNLTTDI